MPNQHTRTESGSNIPDAVKGSGWHGKEKLKKAAMSTAVLLQEGEGEGKGKK